MMNEEDAKLFLPADMREMQHRFRVIMAEHEKAQAHKWANNWPSLYDVDIDWGPC